MDKEKNAIEGASPSDYALLIKKLCHSYGSFTAVSDFTLGIKKGQRLALLGANGAGKTTLISVIMGMKDYQHGEAFISGSPLFEHGSKRSNIGYCPQFDILWPYLTVLDHFMIYAELKQLEDVEASMEYLLDKLDLEVHKQKLISQLSGGMMRRVSLGIALLGDPDVVILDEPTTGLDPLKRM